MGKNVRTSLSSNNVRSSGKSRATSKPRGSSSSTRSDGGDGRGLVQDTFSKSKESSAVHRLQSMDPFQKKDPAQQKKLQKESEDKQIAFMSSSYTNYADRIRSAGNSYIRTGNNNNDDSGGVGSSEPAAPTRLTRFALRNSQLLLGLTPDSRRFNNGSTHGTGYYGRYGVGSGSRYSNSGNSSSTRTGSSNDSSNSGNSANRLTNTEAFANTYLLDNATNLYSKFLSDPNFKEQYLTAVDYLYHNMDVRSLGQAPVEAETSPLYSQSQEGSHTDKLLAANAIASTLAGRPDLVYDIANSGMKLFLADNIVSQGENVAGYYSTGNHMVINRNPGFASFHATVAHETTHKLDHLDGSLDGRISGLGGNWSTLQADGERDIRDTNGQIAGLDSGFLNYSLTNDQEFLAIMSQLYHSDRSDLIQQFPEIHRSLDNFFRLPV